VTNLPDDAAGALAVGWATVELDRAARELSDLLGSGHTFVDAPSSEVLGARCRVGSGASDGGVRIVLLEPATEGRLSATLARHGEGWVATWVAAPTVPTVPPSPAAQLSGARPGPFGEERLVLGGSVTGPHRLVLKAVPSRP
jgi:hypothetical protein